MKLSGKAPFQLLSWCMVMPAMPELVDWTSTLQRRIRSVSTDAALASMTAKDGRFTFLSFGRESL